MHSLVLAALVAVVYAQFPPTPEGVTIVKSKFHEGVTISYKDPSICETVDGVRSYSGYVHLPPNSLNEAGEAQNYPINTFFWFFESRKDPINAPLAIWMNGGPGGSSLMGALQENGPCFINADSNSTYLNPYSWNNEVNMLYLDQPVQVGFSYDELFNGTLEMKLDPDAPYSKNNITLTNFLDGVPSQNNSFLVGTFASQNQSLTANSTMHAAIALWHFAQTWFEEFPQYKPHDEKVSIWAESYGGHYGPAFTQFFLGQNEKIANGTIKTPGAHYIHLDTLGLVNACIDTLEQFTSRLEQGYNGTYPIKLINESVYEQAMYEWSRPAGFRDKLLECKALAAEKDPNGTGENEEVNNLCRNVTASFEDTIESFLGPSNWSFYDISHPNKDPFPGPFYQGFLNQPWVQSRLGVPLNYSSTSFVVNDAFQTSGDMFRGGMLKHLGFILSHGIKVALMYGDRDFACPWQGGESASLAIPYAHSDSFAAAGYAPLLVNESYIGGQVRQYGNLSFSRVYQAGHEVPSYQPEAAYRIFMRAMFNTDIATGLLPLTDTLTTVGPKDVRHITNELLEERPEPVCYVLTPGETCEKEVYETVKNGTAVVKDWVVLGVETDVETGYETPHEVDSSRYPIEQGSQRIVAPPPY